VSPERDEPSEEHEQELYEDVPPRSIFAATWFRVVLVVIVLGVIGAVAVPYVLDWMNPPPPPRSAAASKSPMVPAPAPASSAMPTTSEKSATDQSASDKPSLDKPAGDRLGGERAEKKDSTVIPAPMTPSSSTPARTEPKPSAKAEPKMAAKAADKPAPAQSTAETKPPSAMAATDTPSKASSTAKPSTAKPEAAAKSESTRAAAAKPSTPPRQAVAKATTPAAGSSPYWVQVGAFKDAETAKRVAAKLRDENFKVEESLKRVSGGATSAPAPAVKTPAGSAASTSDQYDVFVTGMSVEDLNRRLAGKGLSAEAASGGVVVKPSLPLRDAVALSKDLAVEGFKVQVRRATGSGPASVTAPTAPVAPREGGQELHRVRVGSFADKAAAVAAARELEAKGYKPYIARGDQ
jgi:cell division septation protein DedD